MALGYIKVLRILISINRKRRTTRKSTDLCVLIEQKYDLSWGTIQLLFYWLTAFISLFWYGDPVQQGPRPTWTIYAPPARCGCEWRLKETEACLTGGGGLWHSKGLGTTHPPGAQEFPAIETVPWQVAGLTALFLQLRFSRQNHCDKKGYLKWGLTCWHVKNKIRFKWRSCIGSNEHTPTCSSQEKQRPFRNISTERCNRIWVNYNN